MKEKKIEIGLEEYKEHNKAIQEHKIPEEVLFDIEMQSYMKYNSTTASMNDWVGELYSYQDIKDIEQAQKEYEKQLKQDYLDGKLVYTEEDLENIRKAWCK